MAFACQNNGLNNSNFEKLSHLMFYKPFHLGSSYQIVKYTLDDRNELCGGILSCVHAKEADCKKPRFI